MLDTFPKHLGRKTFLLILLKYGWVAALPIIGVFAAIFASGAAPDIAAEVDRVSEVIIMLGFILAICALAIAWLEYSHYTIALDESTFKTTHGVLDIEELGFPYRYIHQARILRSVTEQILGVSTLVVTVSSENGEHHEEIILPWLDHALAADLQNALLKKSEIEQMHIASSAV